MQRLVCMRRLLDSVYGGKMLLPGVQIPLEGAIWLLYPAAFASASTVHPITQSCAHLQWHHPFPICQRQRQISFSTPSVTKLLHSHPVLSLINQPSNTHIFLWPSEWEFIIQLLTKSGTPQAVLATAGEVTHILLIYWHDILDKAK